MKAPRPSFTPSRHNVGAYGVRVQWEYAKLGSPSWAFNLIEVYKYRFFGLKPQSYRVTATQSAKVAPDGSLSIEPERWAVRHYRRAVMRGAGVYQAGLWAFLAGQRVRHQDGAALLGNDAGTLARYDSPLKPPPQHVTQVIDMTPRKGEVTGRQIELAYSPAAASAHFAEEIKSMMASVLKVAADISEIQQRVCREVNESLECSIKKYDKAFSISETVRNALSEQTKGRIAEALKNLASTTLPRSESLAAIFEAAKGALAEQRALLESDAERAVFDEVQRQVVRYLRRLLLPRPKRPQHPASIPRPLHARPRPPAAPLAPPAL